ncbi:hypothetical protein [Methyloraptor flagellatus]|uniref:Uncharacterized protein n=1 Tax=Methyloraptor flagellatus TaxID=3162530 RepID=A0AAU7X5K0_9HYPH
MTTAERRTALFVGVPTAVVAFGTAGWLWLRYGHGVYLDMLLGAVAACL